MLTNTPTITMLNWTGPDFRVRMASELICPGCFRPLRPSAVRGEGPEALRLICEWCHVELLTIEPLGG